MRHRMAGRTFGRRPEQRKALMRGLASQLLIHERITTTVEKAKELRSYVEPLITLGKRGDLHARRQAGQVLYGRPVLSKLFGEIAKRFQDRKGGYTRIYKTGRRRGDGAHTAIMELVLMKEKIKPIKKAKEDSSKTEVPAKEDKAKKKEKTEKKSSTKKESPPKKTKVKSS
jgi:large subunit ribosomal protein L17